MHDKPSPTRVVLGYVAIACTVISWLIYMITMILSLFVNNPSLTLRFVVESVLYMTIVTTLIFSALVYLATRQGALYRFIRHERVPRAMLDNHFAHNYGKGITVLIPSYVETAKSRRKNNLVGGIAGISLIVGGIGIMNIMLVSVTERTREIGIRKAIGADYASIMLQFLIEALMISLIGCGIGIFLSWLLIFIAGKIVTTMTFSLSMGVVWLAVAFSAGIGVIFGIYPANKAAKKKPIEALRFS